ncbi:hypothetical protein OH76DRAFT_776188 [Lentinus brumalis]|uniref:Uncharacterized protein n=1 Tax=Lentinus brumalis TaxID=2498619 RepID=A0A371D4B6_9APHY|nr:hypothetical protein OH76DRAFT_776188 [Polyporus brumalis]
MVATKRRCTGCRNLEDILSGRSLSRAARRCQNWCDRPPVRSPVNTALQHDHTARMPDSRRHMRGRPLGSTGQSAYCR